MKKKRLYSLLFLCALTVACLLGFVAAWKIFKFSVVPPVIQTVCPSLCPKKEVDIVIFVHGSFGSPLGLLSFNSVVNDAIGEQECLYKKLTSYVRKTEYFFKDQPMHYRGIRRIDPTYEMDDSKESRLSIYPICQAYQDVLDYVSSQKKETHFYAFGWSGLLSRRRRRHESVRFYNSLATLQKSYLDQGCTPRISILCHSHGGNVSMYLEGIFTLINCYKKNIEVKKEEISQETWLLHQHLQSLPPVSTKKGQKSFDFLPQELLAPIEKLVLMGTPIQPETSVYCLYPSLFKRIYHLYSDEDAVMVLDWVSTHQGYSERRFSFTEKPTVRPPVQVRIIMEKNKNEELAPPKNDFLSMLTSYIPTVEPFKSIMNGSSGPGHKELWFFMWGEHNRANTSPQSVLYPLPVLILFPAIEQLIDRVCDKQVDLDICFGKEGEQFKLFLTPYKKGEILESCCIPFSLLEDIKRQVAVWKANEGDTKQEEYKMIVNHLRALKKYLCKPKEEALQETSPTLTLTTTLP